MDTNSSTDERERRQIAREKKGEHQNVVLIFFAAFSCASRVHYMYHELRRCISTTRRLVNSYPIFVLIIEQAIYMNLPLPIYTGTALPISTIRVINQANYEIMKIRIIPNLKFVLVFPQYFWPNSSQVLTMKPIYLSKILPALFPIID